jgi:crotonobetainyl-CoA:carnitine CoA-transferase CaiB-like acyl-CoA transferase
MTMHTPQSVFSGLKIVEIASFVAADIVVPIGGARDLDLTVNNPITLRGLARVAARRAPEHGEHNDEVPAQLGFSADDIAQLREQKAIPAVPERETTK